MQRQDQTIADSMGRAIMGSIQVVDWDVEVVGCYQKQQS